MIDLDYNKAVRSVGDFDNEDMSDNRSPLTQALDSLDKTTHRLEELFAHLCQKTSVIRLEKPMPENDRMAFKSQIMEQRSEIVNRINRQEYTLSELAAKLAQLIDDLEI